MSYFRIVDSTFWLLFTNNYFIISPHLETMGYNIYDCNYLFHIGKGLLRNSVERTHKCRNQLSSISFILRGQVSSQEDELALLIYYLCRPCLVNLSMSVKQHGSNNPTTSTCLSNLMPPCVVCLKNVDLSSNLQYFYSLGF